MTIHAACNDASVEFAVDDVTAEVVEIRVTAGRRRVRVTIGGKEYSVSSQRSDTITAVSGDRVTTETRSRGRVSIPHRIDW